MTSLDFDDLLDVTALRSALLSATGQGVHVAILDTGVDATHPDLQGAVVRSVEILPPGTYGPPCRELPLNGMSAAELDPVGHGTACAGIIHEVAPEAKLVSVRVIGSSAPA